MSRVVKPNAVNRATLDLVASLNPDELDPSKYLIKPDLSIVQGVPKYFWKIDGDVLREMTQAEKDAVTSVELGPAKKAKVLGVMRATPRIMEDVGFQYNGKTFPMDTAMMARVHLLYDGRTVLTYPFALATRDGDDLEVISDAAEMQAFAGAMIQAVNAAQIAERSVIQTIRGLTDLEAVKNFVDPRL